jgi:hypothetical protein
MTTLSESIGGIKNPGLWLAAGGSILLVWGMVAFPTMHPDRRLAALAASQTTRTEPVVQFYDAAPSSAKSVVVAQGGNVTKSAAFSTQAADSAAGRKVIRTGSMEMIVAHPSETAERIESMAEAMGGYVVSADGGGENAAAGTLTIRVPAVRFEEARAAIRKLGVRVESEKIDAQDVTRQYVDQDASIRNLRAEELQYLSILKQATTVKDMLAVSEKLSDVRGQIEQQQAEFNGLSRQVETVAITISLRTEAEEKVFGLNWRPTYQLKLALRDGLESLANYGTAVATIFFYLPAILLWVGTILAGIVGTWRAARWVGTRWFGWKIGEAVTATK